MTQTMPWHMELLGDMDAIWEDYTGAGVTVAVYDDGVEYDHEDLDDNYDSSQHVTVGGSAADPYPATGDGHGTSVAGLIAAENNDTGYVGVAYDASLVGVNIFTGAASTETGFLEALEQLGDFDVSNHSWGWSPTFGGNGFGEAEAAALFDASIVDGRGGLGAINLKAAGNDDKNANGELAQVGRSTITVAAYDDTGDASWYSNYGANILIAAPSNGGEQGLESTDRSGADGYDPTDYTDDFGGTSGATPVATGVVTLMLEANIDLGWRDVQEILAYSATEVGSGVGGVQTADENHDWFRNGATDWNGGGLHFSEDYGYGGINAYNAVRMAEVWDLFTPEAKTTANEASQTASSTASGAIADGGIYEVMLTPGTSLFEIEYVDVTIEMVHASYRTIVIELISDDGTVIELFDGTDGEVNRRFSGEFDWTFGVTALKGELVGDSWTVRVTDTATDGNTGTVEGVSVTWYGQDEGLQDDVHHFTDEFSEFFGGSLIADTDGGIDWVNTAAIADAVVIDLRSGEVSEIDGVLVGIENMENVVTGDGADIVRGDTHANEIHGMRGNDQLYGRDGDDEIHGGDGRDKIKGNDDDDKLFGGDDRDFLFGGADDDRLHGERGADVVKGEDGNDRLYDAGGNDEYWGGAGNDIFYFRANRGNDVIRDYEDGADRIDIDFFNVADTGGSDVDWLGATANVAQDGGDLVIDWAGGGTLTIQNAQLSDLTDDDFIFV